MIAFPRNFAATSRPCWLSPGVGWVGRAYRGGQKQESVDGIFITVQNPITDATLTQIKNTIDRALNQPGRHIKKIVFDFNPGDSEAASRIMVRAMISRTTSKS